MTEQRDLFDETWPVDRGLARETLREIEEQASELRGDTPVTALANHARVAAEFEALLAAGTTDGTKIVDRHEDWAAVYWRAAQVYLHGALELRQPDNMLTGGFEHRGRPVEVTARYTDGATATELIGHEQRLRVAAERQVLVLAEFLHNVHHLLVRVLAGEAPPRPHEQDRLDAARWLQGIDRALAELPPPKTRLIPAGELGGADVVERYYTETEDP